MRAAALLLACAATLCGADWKIDYKVAKDAKANFETPLTITIQDAKGSPVSGAEVEAVLTMVDMDHGEFKHKANQTKAGTYQAAVKFVMVGAWQIEVRAKKGSETAAKKFRYEISQ